MVGVVAIIVLGLLVDRHVVEMDGCIVGLLVDRHIVEMDGGVVGLHVGRHVVKMDGGVVKMDGGVVMVVIVAVGLLVGRCVVKMDGGIVLVHRWFVDVHGGVGVVAVASTLQCPPYSCWTLVILAE